MILNLASAAYGLEQRDNGLWFARKHEGVSYPARGNIACLAVEDTSFWFRHRTRCIISLVNRFPPDGPFLDIGGGNGYVAKGLAEAGVSCALVEPGIDGALAARSRGIDPVICARLEDLDLPPATIAAAGMFDVLEHIDKDTAALRQVHTLLRPGGRLFLTVPAYPLLYSADDVIAGHFRRYTLSRLVRVLAESGFRAEFSSYMFAPLPLLIFLLRTVPSRLGLRHGADPERIGEAHASHGMTAKLMDRLLAVEHKRIDAGRTLTIGGSCLAVALKG
jgi:SAM-dependent methyltransferase